MRKKSQVRVPSGQHDADLCLEWRHDRFRAKGARDRRQGPSKPVGGFVRIDGGRYYQAIYPDRAVVQSCATCHNEHPNSPRRDYKIGDVMGGIIITIPIDLP